MMFAAGCASIGLSGLDEPAAAPRAIAMFVVSTRKGEHSASNEAVEEVRVLLAANWRAARP